MHTEADALLDAIFDNPDDDTPRLVYADWLQEHNAEDYAQFIRLQCAAARCDEADELSVQIGHVWHRLRNGGWIPAWIPGVDEDRNMWVGDFERGFLRDGLDVTLGEFLNGSLLEHPMALLARVHVAGGSDSELRPDDLELFSAGFEMVRDLRIDDVSPGESLPAFLEWSSCPHLKRLDLRESWIGRDGVAVLLRAPWSATLSRIVISRICIQYGGDEMRLLSHFGQRLVVTPD